MRAIVTGGCVACGLVACGFSPMGNGGQPGRDATPGIGDANRSDGAIDATVTDGNNLFFDGPAGGPCYGSHTVRVCVASAPTAPFNVPSGGMMIDTDTDTMCDLIAHQADGSELCVSLAQSATFDGTLRLDGSRPWVLVSVGDLAIHGGGKLDASSERGSLGPGADPAACSTGGTGRDGASSTHGGGGGGGGFAQAGATASVGGAGMPGGGSAGLPGVATSQPIDVLRGGCAGGGGGGGSEAAVAGGPGGGAIYLISSGSIIIDGSINASGGGGAGNVSGGGGGGGGAGGMIGLDAMLVLHGGASLFADGGGGGEGAGGDPGKDATEATGTLTGLGGSNGSPDGGDGGNGGTASTTGTTPLSKTPTNAAVSGPNGGGGGGGGGGGVIQLFPET